MRQARDFNHACRAYAKAVYTAFRALQSPFSRLTGEWSREPMDRMQPGAHGLDRPDGSPWLQLPQKKISGGER
jgi:hypothetical protein